MLFQNAVSTITRDRNNVKIFMLGNIVNRHGPSELEAAIAQFKPGRIVQVVVDEEAI
jgi:hypothetical protein